VYLTGTNGLLAQPDSKQTKDKNKAIVFNIFRCMIGFLKRPNTNAF